MQEAFEDFGFVERLEYAVLLVDAQRRTDAFDALLNPTFLLGSMMWPYSMPVVRQ